jgi:hypothetical protein
MNCPQCGEICRCLPVSSSIQAQPMSDAENSVSVPSIAPGADDSPDIATAEPSGEGSLQSQDEAPADPDAWRGELTARLDRYRSRRKPRPPHYPSLHLRFEEPQYSAPPAFETRSNQALALEGLTVASPNPLRDEIEAEPTLSAPAPRGRASSGAPAPFSGAKVIEFPRLNPITPPVPLDELAEPVRDLPRILEAPEIELPPPALGGITMEGTASLEIEKRPGIDIPLQSAPLGRRMIAAAIDGVIIAAASAMFGFIFWRVTRFRPPALQLLGLGAAIPCSLWAAYQYLLIVYSASTPGSRVAGLELARFDGCKTNRRLRRWRVLASYLSAVSLGMGYAWVFLDEDALCWHDRITHTYLAPKAR